MLLIVALFSSLSVGQHYAYITNGGEFGDGVNDNLSMVDLATNTVVATIPVGDYPQGVAVNPAGTAVFVPLVKLIPVNVGLAVESNS